MSEKRFIRISVCGDWGVKDTEKDKVLFFGTTDEVIDTVELLNEQHEEIQQSKVLIKKYYNENTDLINENEQLQKDNKRLRKCINEIFTIARLEEL